ncbi:MAG: tryptophan 7-halogenase [Gammaproteobacteria bacterium]|nr:tryptophan 7-halogenase [Gammaproteobacteria bacterium]MBI5615964.1 tryptophan 7-halogenase [Gammaproteobacteria bacterium]
MAAISLAMAWIPLGAEITLLESDAIGIIGVGEGSTPKMRRFMQKLGVAEHEWMPSCNGTYKCGIRFPAWSTRPGYESYYHPFFSPSDDPFIRAFHQNMTLRQRNLDVHALPDTFFLSNYLAKHSRAPLGDGTLDHQTDYAYHFDARLIGEYLRKRSIELGVRHLVDTVTGVRQSESGAILGVDTQRGGFVEADFFLDCSGFASVLICGALRVPFMPYKDFLFNDAAVAMPTPHPDATTLRSETLSSALKYGWVWKIPLTNRLGNGYVYSSDYIDAATAEQELRQHLKLPESDTTEARHLKMRVGRLNHCWESNCLAIGLAQGFIEPLEATALMIVQDTVEHFIELYARGGFTPEHRDAYNEKINRIYDSVRDYVYMHYKLNSRRDTDYWVNARENRHVSDSVAAILEVWDNGGDLLGEIVRQRDYMSYSPTSWFCILSGMARFPKQPRKPRRDIPVIDPAGPRKACMEMLEHYPDHRSVVMAMQPAH